MKHKSKLFGLLAIITMLVPLFVGGIVGGAATQGNVDITLHKKKYDTMPETLKNTGEKMSQFEGIAGLNEVTFEAYNITALVYPWITRATNPLTAEEAINKVVAAATTIQNGGGPVTVEEKHLLILLILALKQILKQQQQSAEKMGLLSLIIYQVKQLLMEKIKIVFSYL